MRKYLFLVALLAMTSCATVQDLFTAKPEDISAVKTAVAKEKEGIALALDLHQQAIKAAYDEGLALANEHITEMRDNEILQARLALVPPATITQATLDAISKTEAELRADAKKHWDLFLTANLKPQAWQDLQDVNDLLSLYILNKMTVAERENAIAQKAHDLVYTSKKPAK